MQVDPELFFYPDGERGPARRERDVAAVAVCAKCPLRLRAACLAGALSRGEEFGVWGGLTEDDRRELAA